MNKFERHSKLMPWSLALLLTALAAGCGGGGDEGRDPILGIGGIAALAPTVTGVAPLNNAIGVGINNTVITATFSEPMDPATLTTATFTVACTVICAKSPTGTVALDATNRIATFTLTNSPLVASTTYTATIATGARSLATGLALASPFVWRFTTGLTADTTRPTVSLTLPANAAPAVPTNRIISAVFSEEMNPATITATGTFTVTCAAPCVSPAGAVTYVVGSRTAVFTPAAVLAANQLYTATITAAATDLSANALIVPAVGGLPVPNPWTFTTAAVAVLDTTAPVISSTNPANGAAAVLVSQRAISATFNEAMNPATLTAATFTLTCTAPCAVSPVPGTVSFDALNNIATFTTNADLTSGATYTGLITGGSAGAKDLAGNPLVQPPAGGLPVPNPWTFTVPAPGATPVALALNLGVAAPFGLTAAAGLSSTGITVVNGDVALTPNSACTDASGAPNPCTGFASKASAVGLTVNGTIFSPAISAASGTTATAIRAALNTAWIEGRAKACDKGAVGPAAALGELGGKTLTKGVYCNANLGQAVGTIARLDAENDVDAVFIFQVGTSMTATSILATPSRIELINGAQARNVWFVIGGPGVGGDLTIGAGATWNGNILAGNTVTINQNTTVNGRVLAGASELSGAVTLSSPTPSVTTINVPQ